MAFVRPTRKLKRNVKMDLVYVHVNGVKLCLWTAATSGPKWRWNDIERGIPKTS